MAGIPRIARRYNGRPHWPVLTLIHGLGLGGRASVRTENGATSHRVPRWSSDAHTPVPRLPRLSPNERGVAGPRGLRSGAGGVCTPGFVRRASPARPRIDQWRAAAPPGSGVQRVGRQTLKINGTTFGSRVSPRSRGWRSPSGCRRGPSGGQLREPVDARRCNGRAAGSLQSSNALHVRDRSRTGLDLGFRSPCALIRDDT